MWKKPTPHSPVSPLNELRKNRCPRTPYKRIAPTANPYWRIRLRVGLAVRPSCPVQTNGREMWKYQSFHLCVCAPAAFTAHVAIGRSIENINLHHRRAVKMVEEAIRCHRTIATNVSNMVRMRTSSLVNVTRAFYGVALISIGKKSFIKNWTYSNCMQ